MTVKDGSGPRSGSRWLQGLLAAAIFLGAWARLRNLGAASLAVDEYYLLEAINNILRTGVPEWICGGFYTRGLLHQYLSAALISSGAFSPEVALRLPSVVSGAAAILGAYLLALRVGGKNVALVVAAILSVSLWEVEFARFGRMYALFQALTMFYALAAVRFLNESRRESFWWMLGLSAAGVLSHEGGILLVALTAIAAAIRPRNVSVAQLIAGLAMLAGAALFLTTDFRFMGVANPYSNVLIATAADPGDSGVVDLPVLYPLPTGLRVVLVVLALSGAFVLIRRYLNDARVTAWDRVLAGSAIALIGVMVALQLYLLAALLLGCAVTLQLLDFRKMVQRRFLGPALGTAAALLVAGTGGAVANALVTSDGGTVAASIIGLIKEGLRYPDLFLKVWVPWRGVMPGLGVAIVVVSIAAVLSVLMSQRESHKDRGYVLLFGITLTLLVGAASAHQPYYATRYTFFLYPLFMVMLVQGVVVLANRWTAGRVHAAIPVALVGLLFLASVDFKPGHLLHIDRPEYLYRTGYDIALQEHLNRRWDFRSVGDALNAGARPEDLVISTVYPVMPYYSSLIDLVYLDHSSQRIWAVSACAGQRDLWSNLPLKFDPDELREIVQTAKRPVWIALMTDGHSAQTKIEAELLATYGKSEVFRSIDGYVALLRIL